MSEEKKYRKGFETGKVIHSAEEWDDERGFWLTKTPLERLEAITTLVGQYILFNSLTEKMDKTIYGKRNADS